MCDVNKRTGPARHRIAVRPGVEWGLRLVVPMGCLGHTAGDLAIGANMGVRFLMPCEEG
jgi:hypothetical protein